MGWEQKFSESKGVFISMVQLMISLIDDYSAIDQSTVKTCSLFSHEVCK